jgi:hypothetical protein
MPAALGGGEICALNRWRPRTIPGPAVLAQPTDGWPAIRAIGIDYAAAIEHQQNGNPHLHILLVGDRRTLTREELAVLEGLARRHGFHRLRFKRPDWQTSFCRGD